MKQELIVKTQPPVLDTNYGALKTHLVAELEKYDVVVTVDTVKDAKALATQLNKTKGQLDARRKQEVAAASEPIKAFDTQMKELVNLCEDGRQKILAQVQTFEAETLRLAQERLQEHLLARYAETGVREEYQRASVDGMAKLTTLTGTGKLTAAACAEVDAKVNECRMLQQQTDLRLSQLENECYRAGLHSPLTREHVEGILFAEEAKYQDALQGMIIRELDRQAETERRATAEAEKNLQDEQAAREAQQATPAPVQAPPAQPVPTPEPEPEPPAPAQQVPIAANAISGARPKVRVRATCTFETFVSPAVSEAAVEAELRKVLQRAGINSLVSVIVTKQASQEKAA
tara:strand:- start:13332 stop:14369 length:1038 start_codon:yes stop_codon:yes gene_type:complete